MVIEISRQRVLTPCSAERGAAVFFLSLTETFLFCLALCGCRKKQQIWSQGPHLVLVFLEHVQSFNTIGLLQNTHIQTLSLSFHRTVSLSFNLLPIIRQSTVYAFVGIVLTWYQPITQPLLIYFPLLLPHSQICCPKSMLKLPKNCQISNQEGNSYLVYFL